MPDELLNKGEKHEMEPFQTLVEPTLEDFKLPGSENDIDDLVGKMIDCGMSVESAEAEIKKRKKQYETAVKKYVTASKKTRRMPKRNSIKLISLIPWRVP